MSLYEFSHDASFWEDGVLGAGTGFGSGVQYLLIPSSGCFRRCTRCPAEGVVWCLGMVLRKAKQHGELLAQGLTSWLLAFPHLLSPGGISLPLFPQYLNISGRCFCFSLVKCLSFFPKLLKEKKRLCWPVDPQYHRLLGALAPGQVCTSQVFQ